MLRSLPLLFLVLNLVACHWNPFKGGDDQPVQNTSKLDLNKKAQEDYDNSSVVCRPQNCPPFVTGVIVMAIVDGKKKVGSCSGTLISPQKVLTNSHCVPSDLREEGSICSGRMKFSFPESPHFKGETIDCQKIAKLSSYSSESEVPIQPDWAIVELKTATAREPAPLNRQGVPPESAVKLYKFDYAIQSPSGLIGYLQEVPCVGNSHFFQVREHLGTLGPLINISSCEQPLKKGNSGSGVFNSQGELVGIFSFARFVRESNGEWAKELRAKYPNIDQDYGGGSNLACIEELNENELSPWCHYGDEDRYIRLASFYQKLYQTLKSEDELAQVKVGLQDFLNSVELSSTIWQESKFSLFENLSIQFSATEKEQQQLKKIYQTALQAHYPYFPKCVGKDLSDHFFLDAPRLVTPTLVEIPAFDARVTEFDLKSVVNAQTLMATQEMESEFVSLEFERISEGEYRVSVKEGDFLTDHYGDILQMQDEKASLTLPLCE